MVHRAAALSRPRPRRRARVVASWSRLAPSLEVRLARLVPGRAAAQRRQRRRARRRSAGCFLVAGLARGRARASRFAKSYLGHGPGEAEPRREPAPAAADRPGRRADRRRRRSRSGELVLRALGLRPACSTAGSGSPLGFGLGTTGLGLVALIVGPARAARALADPGRAGGADRSPRPACRSSGERREVRRRSTVRRRDGRPGLGSPWLGFAPGRRPVPADHGPGGDAADDRLRRDRVSPPRAEGIFPGRADRASCRITSTRACRSAWRCSTCSAWRCSTTGGRGRWSGQLAGRARSPRRRPAMIALTARRLGLAAGGLGRGGRLPDDPLGLPAGRPPLRRGAALLLPRGAGLGGRSGPGPRPSRPSEVAALGRSSGLLAGGAMACKYPALISAVVPFGLVAPGRRRSGAGRWRLVARASPLGLGAS